MDEEDAHLQTGGMGDEMTLLALFIIGMLCWLIGAAMAAPRSSGYLVLDRVEWTGEESCKR